MEVKTTYMEEMRCEMEMLESQNANRETPWAEDAMVMVACGKRG